MLWLIGIVGIGIGVIIGVLAAGRFSNSDPDKIVLLESRVEELQASQTKYRENVSEHFGTTAELVQQMTESYREVYQHLANGAQELCTKDVARKLLPASEHTAIFNTQSGEASLEAPKDYAAKADPNSAGALSEEFGHKARHKDGHKTAQKTHETGSSASVRETPRKTSSEKPLEKTKEAST